MRSELFAIAPDRVKRLPVDPVRGYPVPWFVPIVDGKPEFRAADARKFAAAVRGELCWVCGQPLGRFKAFVIGPMCSISRIAGDPPSHRDCAEFSARACPFLVNPDMVRRRGDNLPLGGAVGGGVSLDHNPGACLVWVTREARLVSDGRNGVIFTLGEPDDAVTWWREGRPATRAEALEAMERGLPKLEALCTGPGDRAELDRLCRRAGAYLPAAGPELVNANERT